MEALVQLRKSLVLILVKQTQNFAWVSIFMLISLKPTIKISTFQVCLGSICIGFSATGSREVCLNGNVYDFSVKSIDKSDILNIQNNIIKMS